MSLFSPSLMLASLLAASAMSGAAHGQATLYTQTNLVADQPGIAVSTDPNLINPWGVAFDPGGAFWINDNGTGLSTLYDGRGDVIPAVFVVPPPAGQSGPSTPTGEVVNSTSGFVVPGTSIPSVFMFSTEDGTISAWGPNLPNNPLNAVLAVDNSKAGTVYKGLEFGVTAAGTFIYATNFHANSIDVFDKTFAPANAKLLGNFQDPDLPKGYAPFGIRNINGNLFVTYALQDKKKHDDVPGKGHGYVDVFDTDGHLLQHLASAGALNSPWGIALAPAGFGSLSNDVLIGNFGDGTIDAFTLAGKPRGMVKGSTGKTLAIEGLWGLYFGGAAAAAPDTLYFTAGPGHEQHGLFGSITPN